MAIVDLVMPKMGESIMEATILRWHKQVGDKVEEDETVLEIATDKVDSEVPSIAEGEITEILYHENDVVPVGNAIARIKTTEEATVEEEGHTTPPVEEVDIEADASAIEEEYEDESQEIFNNAPSSRFYSPLVLKIAQEEGIPMAELENMPGSGNEGRVTKKDILQYVDDKKEDKTALQTQQVQQSQPSKSIYQETSSPAVTNASASSISHRGNVEIIEMDRMRRLTAEHMVRSKQISPHVTSYNEADVTLLVNWRNRIKRDFEQREGEKITFTPLFIEAIVKCIKKFPMINSSVDGNNIILKKDINIGMATALRNGNLIVPVIKNADQLNLTGLSKKVNSLANAARTNQLKAEDTQDGTFTFTNVGTFGSLTGAPIINQPQSAILAVGAIKKRPVVIETEDSDSIAIRHMMYLSMSYDHRIIDGSLGATFLTAVANELENFDMEREV